MKKILSTLFISLAVQSPALSNGVSMTNSPSASSSGSVTNMAVQNVPSRQFTNLYSTQQLQCQSDTLVIQPFVTSNLSYQTPHKDVKLEPIYDERDLTGSITKDDNGNDVDGPDGAPDNPGAILGYKTVELNQKSNVAISPGISLSWNINLDRRAVRKCREGAAKIVELIELDLNDKRLALEMGRLQKCGELFKANIRFKPGSKYELLCQDVEIVNTMVTNTLPNHVHTISSEVNAKED